MKRIFCFGRGKGCTQVRYAKEISMDIKNSWNIGMKINIAGLFAVYMLTSCASTPPPQWVENLEAAFPGDKYIAVRGTSGRRETVIQEAQTVLSFYFQTQVSSSTNLADSYREQNGAVSQSVQMERRMLVQTEAVLQNVQFTAPWRNPGTGLWEIAAYINREKAWEAFSSHAKKSADELAQLFVGAREENADPFICALNWSKAEAYAAGEEFITAWSYAQILDPVRAEVLFNEVNGYRPALPREAADARRNASVYLECPLDLNGLILNAAKAAFSTVGFPIASERGRAEAVCVIHVTEGLLPRPPGTGTFYRPVLVGNVTSRAGTAVFSFDASAEVQSAIDPDLARSRAYAALAHALRDTLPKRLREGAVEAKKNS
jgi:hypothetical protein